jgi:hypothetical protein
LRLRVHDIDEVIGGMLILISRKANFFTAGTVALLAFAGLAACGGANQSTMSPGTCAAHGVSFHYPRGWHRGPGRSVGFRSRRLWAVAVGTRANSVDVTAGRLGAAVTRQNLPV